MLAKRPGERAGKNDRNCKYGILIVEDDSVARNLLRTILSGEGYQIFEADCEAQARKIWRQHFQHIDLLLTDICIPYQATGVELANKLRAEKSWLKVIYTSGFSADIVADDTLPLIQNVNFFCKPYPSGNLLDALSKCFQTRGSLFSSLGNWLN